SLLFPLTRLWTPRSTTQRLGTRAGTCLHLAGSVRLRPLDSPDARTKEPPVAAALDASRQAYRLYPSPLRGTGQSARGQGRRPAQKSPSRRGARTEPDWRCGQRPSVARFARERVSRWLKKSSTTFSAHDGKGGRSSTRMAAGFDVAPLASVIVYKNRSRP